MSQLTQRALARIARALPPKPSLWLEVTRCWESLPELRLAAGLCRRDRGAIDIGANNGLFSWVMSKRAAWCVAVEPNPTYISRLRQALPDLDLHQCALGSSPGRATLSIPVVKGIPYGGYGSLASTTVLSEYPHQSVEVAVETLDSFSLQHVGVIKIDVEGYEEQVLDGAVRTITRDRPSLLIEIEERHNPGGRSRIERLLSQWGYGPAEPVKGAENNVLFRAPI
jgi:FkbM family methyltransferase